MNNLKIGDNVRLRKTAGGCFNHAMTDSGRGVVSSAEVGVVERFHNKYCEYVRGGKTEYGERKSNYLAPLVTVNYSGSKVSLFSPAFNKVSNV